VIIAWMLFSLFTGCALTAAAAACDRLASLSRRPRRFIWLAAMIATICWPVISLIQTAFSPVRDTDTGSLIGATHRLSSIAVTIPGWEMPAQWGFGLLVAWALVSSAMLGRLALAIWYIRRSQVAWPTMEIDGVSVRVAPDAGPAVVGFSPMDVVLPEWVLEMELPLRALVLRHETEHRASGDPFLLLVATLVTGLIPWNVALWFQARRLRLVIEIDCDARVLSAHPGEQRYAFLLLTIAQRRAGTKRRLVPALSEPISNLERRITAMHATRRLSRSGAVCLGLAAATAFAVACAVDRPESTDASSRTTASNRTRSVTSSSQSLDPATPTFFEFQVDTPATLRENVSLRYPSAMKAAGISGEVSAQYVVDETGRIEMPTFKVLKSSGPEFTAAVIEVLPSLRLNPASVHGKKVKQLVQQSFEFGHPPRS
jgi:beta-lactamase regulating signal transducer with metallopeptidase domain